MKEAYIEFYRHENENGERWTTCKWIGGKSDYVVFTLNSFLHMYSDGVLKQDLKNNQLVIGPIVTVGQYRLRQIKSDHPLEYWYMLDGYRAILYSLYFKFMEWLKLINSRFLFTLSIWNLADHEPGMMQSWRDIKIIKRFIK